VVKLVYNRWVQVNPMELPSSSLSYYIWLLIKQKITLIDEAEPNGLIFQFHPWRRWWRIVGWKVSNVSCGGFGARPICMALYGIKISDSAKWGRIMWSYRRIFFETRLPKILVMTIVEGIGSAMNKMAMVMCILYNRKD
jgi:hypothetical protein